MNIVGRKVVLRAIEPEDLPLIHRWSNDPDICYRVGSWHFPSSMWHMRQWYERIQSDELNPRFAVDSVEHGLIGTANLMDINWKDRNALPGILLGDKAMRGKGYGTDTLMAIMRYAFEELGLQRLDSTIIEHNTASLNLFTRSCGWVEEGRQRKWYWRKNRYWDRVLVGITRDEYLALIRETRYWDANA
jgi:RimJ/RimL family protein N-acetyltransferase